MKNGKRVVSGMRATGKLHLGNYHGALKQWLTLQHEYECFFFVADWHALTTDYAHIGKIRQNSIEMVLDWLGAGLNPKNCTIFMQSQVLEHAEMHLLLSMITPLSWLERVPTFKDQQDKLKKKDLATYGFLGYPVLQSADILLYKPSWIPVGEDQASHVEITRKIARRFNHLYGHGKNFQDKANVLIQKKFSKRQAKLFREYIKLYKEQRVQKALQKGRDLLSAAVHLTINERDNLAVYLEDSRKIILSEPECLLSTNPKLPGLDRKKMSKSCNNTIELGESDDIIAAKIKKMSTDPARIRRSDPGDSEKCPVWDLHKVYSDNSTKIWVQEGCHSASIGCIDCKKSLIDTIIEEQRPIRERRQHYEQELDIVKDIIYKGGQQARMAARITVNDVREAMGLIVND